jgi:hypothetical protein
VILVCIVPCHNPDPAAALLLPLSLHLTNAHFTLVLGLEVGWISKG